MAGPHEAGKRIRAVLPKKGTRGMLMRLLLLLGLAVLPAAAQAAQSVPVVTPRATARLVTDMDRIAPGIAFRVGLQLSFAPGWHGYWHNPGDAGAAPTLRFDTAGLTTGGFDWPLPRRLPDGPAMSFGYTGQVLLTVPARYAGAADGLTLTAQADYLVCEKLCVPEHAAFVVHVAVGAAQRSADWPLFEATAHLVPRPAPWPARIGPDGTLWVSDVPAGSPVFFLPDAAQTTVLRAPQPVRRLGATLALRLTPSADFRPGAPMTGVLVVGERAVRLTATPGVGPAGERLSTQQEAEQGEVGRGWAMPLLLAFAGGLVLNLMPCVFPILAMKAIGLAGLAGQARRNVRLQALAYTAGVLASFAVVAALVLGLRAAGAAAGWGVQFQWPGFVAAMAWLFLAIGLNLSGAYAIGGGWGGAGQRWTGGGVLGSAATGVLAVLVATPCTAPFMGAAVAATATAPSLQAIGVFLALGLGFSLPWTVLALVPGLAAWLPRPGAWMERLRQALAFPMFGTVVWLVWVVSRQAGSSGVLAVGAGLVLVGLAAWGLRVAEGAQGLVRRAGLAISLAGVLGAGAMLPMIAAVRPIEAAGRDAGEAFSPDRLAALREAGRPVLVNMTAAWCVTCLVNERLAIAPALPRLRANGVAYLTGDWTSQDERITRFLRAYGRAGVPLYVFFPASGPARVLPQVLSAGIVGGLR